jgi:hypothetical protein
VAAAAASSIRHKTQDGWVLYFFGDGHPLRFLLANLAIKGSEFLMILNFS